LISRASDRRRRRRRRRRRFIHRLKVEPARGRAGAEGELVALDLGHEVLRVVVL
jgi:hypothetical protein